MKCLKSFRTRNQIMTEASPLVSPNFDDSINLDYMYRRQPEGKSMPMHSYDYRKGS